MPSYKWYPADAPTTNEDGALYHRTRTATAIKRRKLPYGRLVLETTEEPVLLLYLDTETTGLDVQTEAITQFSVECVLMSYESGASHPRFDSLAKQTSFVHTSKRVSSKITELTGITQADVDHASPFERLHTALSSVIQQMCVEHQVTHCIWIAHNGFMFDAPIWSRYLHRAEGAGECAHSLFSSSTRQHWYADSLFLSRAVFDYLQHCGSKPDNNRLGTLASFWGIELSADDSLHRADTDVWVMRQVMERMMECHGLSLLFQCVVHDAYFTDCMNPSRAVKRVRFESLVGVHGQRVQWTDQQRAILTSPIDQHACVVAGAGCAKTTTLIGRIIVLLRQGVPAHRIVLTTFSRDATDDMVARLTQWVGAEVPIVANTIDGLARYYLKQYAPEQLELCEHVSEYKVRFLHFLKHDGGPHRAHVLQSVDHILVDEFQDMNHTYYGVLKAFVNSGAKLTVVGDDAQSIYGWNGAELRYLLEFGSNLNTTHTTYPNQTYYLTKNFRSTPEIVNVANQSIARNTEQLPKTIDATKPSLGQRPVVHRFHSREQEARAMIPELHACLLRGETVAVLCRNCTDHGPLFHYEAMCKEHNVPCMLLERYHDRRAQVNERAVMLLTMHKSKGLEWDHVIVVGCSDRYFPHITHTDTSLHDEQLHEERRLFYVATTRAKRRLVYTFVDAVPTANVPMTRFLSELPRSLFEWRGGIHPQHHNALAYAPTNHSPTHDVPVKPNHLAEVFKGFSTATWMRLREQIQGLLCAVIPHLHSLRALTESVSIHGHLEPPTWVASHHMHDDVARWYTHVLARVEGVPSHSLMQRILYRVVLMPSEYRAWYEASQDETLKTEWRNSAAAKIQQRASALNVSTDKLHPSTRADIPFDVRKRLEHAWKVYENPDLPWSEVLCPAFEVSWCAALERGRMRTLHQKQHELYESVQSLALAMRVSAGELYPRLLKQRAATLHETVESDCWVDELPLLLTNEHAHESTLLEVRLVDEWTLNDTVSQIVRMAHANRQPPTNTAAPTWNTVCVYNPWSGSLQTMKMPTLSDDVWDQIWSLFTNIVSHPQPSDERMVCTDNSLTASVANREPVFSINTPSWKTIAQEVKEDICF